MLRGDININKKKIGYWDAVNVTPECDPECDYNCTFVLNDCKVTFKLRHIRHENGAGELGARVMMEGYKMIQYNIRKEKERKHREYLERTRSQ